MINNILILDNTLEKNNEIKMEEGTLPKLHIDIDNISLRPSWYGKIDWADWRSVSPKLAEQYDRKKHCKNINENYGKYISPVYDERLEYVKSILQSNYKYTKYNDTKYNDNYNDNTNSWKNKNNTHNNQDEFIVYNKKTKSSKHTSSRITNRHIKNNDDYVDDDKDNSINDNDIENNYEHKYDNDYDLENQTIYEYDY